MVLLVHLEREATLALLENLEMLAIQAHPVTMENQEVATMYQVNQLHLVDVETLENWLGFLISTIFNSLMGFH